LHHYRIGQPISDTRGFAKGASADAIHAAVATVYELEALISWNLRHLANFNKMAKINAVHLACGYTKKLELITPLEVINHD